MNTGSVNQRIYSLWAPVYDAIFKPLSARPRRHAIDLLALRPGECVLLPGVGTGLDLPLLPAGVEVLGIEYNPAMLAQARRKQRADCPITLLHGDAQALELPDASVDAVIFHLVLSVIPDGAAAFREGWRVLRPGGRAVIFDKFLPETRLLTGGRRVLGRVISLLGTDPNRRFSDIVGATPGVIVRSDEPSLLRGQYRVILLEKSPSA